MPWVKIYDASKDAEHVAWCETVPPDGVEMVPAKPLGVASASSEAAAQSIASDLICSLKS